MNATGNIIVQGDLYMDIINIDLGKHSFTLSKPDASSLEYVFGYFSNGDVIRNMASTDEFFFPIGKSGETKPIAILPSTIQKQKFAVRVINNSPVDDGYSYDSMPDSVHTVQVDFYHSIQRFSGTDEVAYKIFLDDFDDFDKDEISVWNEDFSRWELAPSFVLEKGSSLYPRVAVLSGLRFVPSLLIGISRMKKSKFDCIGVLDIEWTGGANSSDWYDPDNWNAINGSSFDIPGVGVNVLIESTSNSWPILPAAAAYVEVEDFCIKYGFLILNNVDLQIHGNASFLGGQIGEYLSAQTLTINRLYKKHYLKVLDSMLRYMFLVLKFYLMDHGLEMEVHLFWNSTFGNIYHICIVKEEIVIVVRNLFG